MGSLSGQINKYKSFPATSQDSFRLRNTDFFKKFDIPAVRDLDRFGFYQDSSFFKDKNVRLYSDFVVVEEFPGASRFYGSKFLIKPDTRGKILTVKPDTTRNVKYHLIIKDPFHY
jgi:hypothetical protein